MVKLIYTTVNAESTMAYLARVSSSNQTGKTGLLKYCADHGHWSVFEMADMCVEIETSRAIAAQILRHKSFSFQEFSQRYAAVEMNSFVMIKARSQDHKNRQNSIDNLPEDIKKAFEIAQLSNWDHSYALYDKFIKEGVAKECARMLLPLNTRTRMYMKGSVRSWIHYLQVRCEKSTQLEHREIADGIKEIFVKEFPVVAEACL